jgi:hypothetical protein
VIYVLEVNIFGRGNHVWFGGSIYSGSRCRRIASVSRKRVAISRVNSRNHNTAPAVLPEFNRIPVGKRIAVAAQQREAKKQ